MRSKKALTSTIIALILQVVNILSAMIIPRMIIGTYGSSVNGLIQSITQFLGYISLLQLGVGGVIRAALYKPLADKDEIQINKVVKAASIFFRKIGGVSCGYILVLAIIYPLISEGLFDYKYVAFLVIIIGLSTIAQYMLGFPYRLLVTADQKLYIYDFIQIIATILNVIFTIILIKFDSNIHIVKFVSSIVFIGQPFVLNIYVKKHYNINDTVKPDNHSVEQRWAGMGYSLADFVHRKADIFVLTLFSTFQEVSVYSVYMVIANGLNSIISLSTNSFQAALGDMLVKKEDKNLTNTMNIYIFIVHFICSIIFSTALIMLLPFVKIYTNNIIDINYTRPVFAILLLLSNMIFCLRQPYQSLVIAAGMFRETQKGAIIEAIINIAISILLVNRLGMLGVSIGTLVAMIYRTIDLARFLHSNIIEYDLQQFVKRYVVTLVPMMCFFVVSQKISINPDTYSTWIIQSVIVTLLISGFIIIINYVFYKKDMIMFIDKICHVLNSIIK
ncbi:lipopolysaccharide biosynthesis protein [Enterococcus casseliflavus]|uniref:lipopolysaccharide biosynthesis protein n=1 Tax=Enterococcus casseliflavus TaxID=37734 RepID=UPI003D151D7A